MGVVYYLILLAGLHAPSEPTQCLSDYWQKQTFADCQALLNKCPQEILSYECFWRIARRNRTSSEAAALLEAMLAADPGNHRALLYLAAVHADLYSGRAKDLMQQAIAGLQSDGDLRGEFSAHLGLQFILREEGALDDAEHELTLAQRIATRLDNPYLSDDVQFYRAWLAVYRSTYGKAWILFKQLEGNVRPGSRRDFKANVLDGLAATAWSMGRYHEALLNYQRELEAVKPFGLLSWEADISYQIAILAPKVREPKRFTPEELHGLEEVALQAAIRAKDKRAEGRARLLMGKSPSLERADRIANLEQAVQILREVGNALALIEAMRSLAMERLAAGGDHPEAAFDLIDEAIALSRTEGSPEEIAEAMIVRSRMRWRSGPRRQAIADSLAALDAIEDIRGAQTDPRVNARVLGRFASAYHELSGYLLDPSKGPVGPEALARAFGITERMRARVLLQTLGSTGGRRQPKTPGAKPASVRLRTRIADVQMKLMGTGLPPLERERLLAELDRLEVEEAASRNERGEAGGRAFKPVLACLADIMQALEEDQALLAFQIEQKPTNAHLDRTQAGGSWLIAVTRGGARAYRLPDREVLESRIQLFLGLIERRDASERRGASLLYRQLLADAMSDLPPEVRRLIVLPDGPLYALPLGALRVAPEADPLATSFQLSVAPSATLWLRWKNAARRIPRLPVLAVANPSLQQAGGDASHRGAGLFRTGLRLGALPYAREEALDIVERLGGRSQLLEGSDASEHRIKSLPLRDFGILHFAAHAVVDQEHPYRSAVVLAPGAEGEDGLLQVPEIAALDLDGQVVILSTCSAATGALLEGEGVMSLSRAFFQAGARAVIGNLWPLRDDEASQLVGDLVAQLAQGRSLGQALMAARAGWVQEGRPTCSWAGLVLQGDADWVPFSGRARSFGAGRKVLAILAAVLLAVFSLWTIQRRHHRLAAGSGSRGLDPASKAG